MFLANREPTLSRAALQRLILDERITVNGLTVKPSQGIAERARRASSV
ncbi:MAG: hypothetical protein AABZ22_08710 [Nitrospirota bacterium]